MPVRKQRARLRRGPERCPAYLAWIRTLPCILCGRINLIEAAHINAVGPRGLWQKTSDFSAVPLCAPHHREAALSYHRLGEQRFAREHDIDLPQLVGTLNDVFQRHTARSMVTLEDSSSLGTQSSSNGIRR